MSEPLEIERKFEVHNFKKEMIPENAETVFVIQDYLKSSGKEVRRVRCVELKNETIYYLTIKRPTGQRGTRIEIESIITKEEYENHLLERDSDTMSVKKFRYVFPYEGYDIEVDLMVEPEYVKDRVFLEVEVPDINAPIKIPPEFEVTERTDDDRYSNHSISKGLLPSK